MCASCMLPLQHSTVRLTGQPQTRSLASSNPMCFLPPRRAWHAPAAAAALRPPPALPPAPPLPCSVRSNLAFSIDMRWSLGLGEAGGQKKQDNVLLVQPMEIHSRQQP
jgi:hypothetical protein